MHDSQAESLDTQDGEPCCYAAHLAWGLQSDAQQLQAVALPGVIPVCYKRVSASQLGRRTNLENNTMLGRSPCLLAQPLQACFLGIAATPWHEVQPTQRWDVTMLLVGAWHVSTVLGPRSWSVD